MLLLLHHEIPSDEQFPSLPCRAFDLSLDADTLSTHHSENTYSHHTRRYHQTSSDHSPDPDASPISSSSNWTTSRRVSLAPTEISQASSAGTSTFTSPGGLSTVESNLAATVKHSPKTEDDQRHETSRKGLIPSTPWASSLVTISNSGLAPSLRRPSLQPSSTKEDTVVKLPPRKSSLQQLNQYSVQQQLPMKTLDISPSQSQSQSHSLIRSRLPKMGMMPNFTRRPSDTPSHASSTQSTSSSSKSVYNTPRLLNGHRSPGSPSGASSVGVSNGDGGGNRATLAAFSINKLRTTKSTPLLRIRKSSAQLTSVNGIPMQRGQSQSDMMSKESDKEENEKEGMDQFGIRKGSLPDISNRSDPLMRKKTSFLPSSMRKN